jgi:hypothetical protein
MNYLIKEKLLMSIKDNPELDRFLNGSNNINSRDDDFGGKSPRYCQFCGKVIVYNTKDNQFMDIEWNNRICDSCFQKGINNPESDIYKEYYGLIKEKNIKKEDDDKRRDF